MIEDNIDIEDDIGIWARSINGTNSCLINRR